MRTVFAVALGLAVVGLSPFKAHWSEGIAAFFTAATSIASCWLYLAALLTGNIRFAQRAAARPGKKPGKRRIIKRINSVSYIGVFAAILLPQAVGQCSADIYRTVFDEPDPATHPPHIGLSYIALTLFWMAAVLANVYVNLRKELPSNHSRRDRWQYGITALLLAGIAVWTYVYALSEHREWSVAVKRVVSIVGDCLGSFTLGLSLWQVWMNAGSGTESPDTAAEAAEPMQ